MMGDSAQGETRDSGKQVPGLYVLAAQDIFDTLEKVTQHKGDLRLICCYCCGGFSLKIKD